MSLEIVLQPKLVEFDLIELERWRSGDRDRCADPWCRNLDGSAGFGEYLVGKHFEECGYEWIHHDFDVFGTNRPGKYPRSEGLLLKFFGEERLAAIKSLCKTLKPCAEVGRQALFETPDLLLFKSDASEVRFAECKRTDTGDRINTRQVEGLSLLASVLGCPVDLFMVAPRGSAPSLEPCRFGFPAL